MSPSEHDGDPHFAVHRQDSSDYAPTTESADEESHPTPQRLTLHGYETSIFGTIQEGVSAKGGDGTDYPTNVEKISSRRVSTSRDSVQSGRSIQTNASAYTVREIYGDITPAELELQRETTRQSIMDRLSRSDSKHYQELARVDNNGEDNANLDGSEFKNVDPELVTWEGPDDPQNPRNWASRKKWITTGLVSMYTFVSTFSSSIPSPAVPLIADDFGVANNTLYESLIVSIFILAWAICPLFIGPFSELWGRRIVLDISIVVLLIFNIACAVSQNTTQILVFRFFSGMAGAPPICVGAGALADMFCDEQRNLPMALYAMGPTLGPIIAPIISGWISMSGKWRWVFWGMSIINGIIAVLGVVFYRETFAPVLLKAKAEKLRKETGNSNLHTVFELTEQTFWKRLFIATSRPLTLLTTHPIIIGLGLYMAFVYGFLYIFIVAFPSLWETYYGYSVGISSLMYIGFGVGQFISIATWTPMVDWKFHSLTKANGGVSRPEFRIPLLIYSSFILAIGLFWYGWSAQARIMWLMPLIGVAIFGWGIFPVFLCVQNYLIDMNPRYAASSVGAAMVFRCLFGFGFPLFGSAMYDRLGYGWSNTLCGILCLILGTPFPLFIYKYGERVRSWTDDHVGHLYSK